MEEFIVDELAQIAVQGKSFNFLEDEPELYTIDDVK